MERATVANRWNLALIEDYHERWRKDPASVEESWRSFFEGYEVGQQDGAAYKLSTIGPSVDGAVAIDEGTETFFRDPITGQALTDMFRLRTSEFATENFAKASYYSPRVYGVQLAGSF